MTQTTDHDGADPTADDAAIPDHQLVQRVLEGDNASFERLVRRHQAQVFRTVVSMIGDQAATSDLMQQAFIKAFDQLDRFDGSDDRSFGPWVRTIARNLVRDDLRRREREQRYLARYRSEFFAESEDAASAERRAERLKNALVECRRRLAPAASEVIRLRYEIGMDVAAIAVAVGRSLGATKQLLFRTREGLRRCVEVQGGFQARTGIDD